MRFLHVGRRPAGALGVSIASSRIVQASHCRVRVEGALADSCIELYLNFGPRGREVYSRDSSATLAPRMAWVLGPRTTTILVSKEVRDCDVVAIRLNAGMAKALLGLPASELQGRLVDLNEFWGDDARRLWQQLAEIEEPSDRLCRAESLVHERIRRSPAYEAARRAQLLCAHVAHHGRSSVSEVADAAGISHRALIQTFDDHVGLKPKAFQRVARFRRVIETLGADNPTGRTSDGWAAIASRFDYFDQAHLIDEFRALTTVSPTEYVRRRVHVGDGFIADRLAE